MELPESKMQYGHYSLGMQPDKIIVWARKAREELVALWGDKKYLPIFVYSGMSGISHATALSMEWHREMNTINFGMMYVRKAGEVSHGRHVQHTLSHMKVSEGQPIFVFVDDCIGGGHTRTRTVLRAKHFLAKIAIPGNHQSIIAVNRALHPELIYQILTYEVRSMKMPDEKDWKGLDVMKEIEQDRGSWC